VIDPGYHRLPTGTITGAPRNYRCRSDPVCSARPRTAGLGAHPLRLRSVEQFGPAFLLRIVRVFGLQPSDAPAIRIGQAFGDDAFEIVGTHQLEQFAPPALDGERLGNDRRSLRQNSLQSPPTLGERQSAQVGAVEPEDVESRD